MLRKMLIACMACLFGLQTGVIQAEEKNESRQETTSTTEEETTKDRSEASEAKNDSTENRSEDSEQNKEKNIEEQKQNDVEKNQNSPIKDIAGHAAEKEIISLFDNKIISSTDGLFRPDEEITMAEFIVLLLKSKQIEPFTDGKSSFSDVPLQNWVAPYAETAFRLGIIQGTVENGKRTLNPNGLVERQELIAILNRASGKSGEVNNVKWSTTYHTLKNYPDSQDVPTWSQREYAYALQNEETQKALNGKLEPEKKVTRAETASQVYYSLFLPDKQEASSKNTTPVEFPYKRVLQVKTTAYDFTNGPTKGYLGWDLREGIVAVDPSVIPLGTHLYIEGYGYAVAADIGSKVKKNHIDLFMISPKQARDHGIKQAKVYILN
ncbi:3D domain-containing protein [Brevibacillus laterosporus]|uniref:3D domain-containing protein n=1 Tax=Brevibacillus laterosporus TaxID=1465 RepID=A0AAP3DFM5_BRELA|nr:3D domain-containing protein [Brevibacillus laterosporus]MCR8979826.1 3D domain-containing protein [Brevibacillus laterosporus]MCZ0806981.1 3D domain-containing protein [Brevibacillus laterosporus]MCZ0827960.1 3D domain-containing protein [Brevibacillus laterosporus]MCZ0851957.1 3D domain-containing protein [Brevibacillus laterosporus]